MDLRMTRLPSTTHLKSTTSPSRYLVTMHFIAQELVKSVKRSVSVDWTRRENARAQIRVIVKRILRKYGYPPDKQEKATKMVNVIFGFSL